MHAQGPDMVHPAETQQVSFALDQIEEGVVTVCREHRMIQRQFDSVHVIDKRILHDIVVEFHIADTVSVTDPALQFP
jgi:hypothetical protein